MDHEKAGWLNKVPDVSAPSPSIARSTIQPAFCKLRRTVLLSRELSSTVRAFMRTSLDVPHPNCASSNASLRLFAGTAF